jgi:putative ABC transport system ATP-binding protein
MAHQVMDLLEQIHADGTTIVMVTHDPDLANRAERNIHLIDGRVAAEELVFTPRESVASMQANSCEQLAAQS